MAHKKAAIKALRQTKKHTERNMLVKKNITYLRRQLLKAVSVKDKTRASEWLAQFVKYVDKAAQKNVIAKNSAARKKVRATKKVRAIA